jgi:hypothetical protein
MKHIPFSVNVLQTKIWQSNPLIRGVKPWFNAHGKPTPNLRSGFLLTHGPAESPVSGDLALANGLKPNVTRLPELIPPISLEPWKPL